VPCPASRHTCLSYAVNTWHTDCDSFHVSARLPKRPV
jgi:hypothetical protein